VERLAAIMAWAELRGRDRGLRGASSAWLAIWVLTVAWRHLKEWTQPEPVVVRERLAPGQRLVITNYVKGTEPPEPETGRRRRRRKG
jgi:hypothetical protein